MSCNFDSDGKGTKSQNLCFTLKRTGVILVCLIRLFFGTKCLIIIPLPLLHTYELCLKTTWKVNNCGTKLIFANRSHFVLIEEHVRNAICHGKLAPRLRTHQVAVDGLDLEEDVVRFLEELLIVLVLLTERGG